MGDAENSAAPAGDAPAAGGQSEYICFHFMGPTYGKHGFTYRVKFETNMGKMKKSYAERIGEPLELLTFFHQRIITDVDTPKSLEMEEEDEIHVQRYTRSPSPEEARAAGGQSEYITLKVVGQDSNDVYFRVKFGMRLGRLKKSYADRTGVSVSSLRFLFDGRRINHEDTAKSLELEEDDIIEVYQEQLGGYILP